jgi:dolichol kinase
MGWPILSDAASPKLPWSGDKSLAGSFSVLVGGWLMGAFILFLYVSAGVFSRSFSSYLVPPGIVALVGALVESLPHKDVDNITVTLASVIIGLLVF